MLPKGEHSVLHRNGATAENPKNGKPWVVKYAPTAHSASCPSCASSRGVIYSLMMLVAASAFSKAYPDSVVDEKFAQHWDTWFTQNDVAQLKAAGINTIRIPVCVFG